MKVIEYSFYTFIGALWIAIVFPVPAAMIEFLNATFLPVIVSYTVIAVVYLHYLQRKIEAK